MKAKGLIVRTLSGLLMVVLMFLFCMNTYIYAAASVWIIWILTEELYRMLVPGRRLWREKLCVYAAQISFFALAYCHFQFGLDLKWSALSVVPLMLAYVFMLFDCCSDYQVNTAVFFPVVYFLLPVSSLMLFVFSSGSFEPSWLLFCIFITVCSNDVGAYIFGMGFGQKPGSRKLFPALSPKKSWWGAFGGLFTTCLVAVVCWIILGPETMPLLHWIVIALISVVFGIFGDLFESLIKRHAQVKDAGKVMPGHGGALDRFDSWLPVMPLIILYLKLVSFI